MGFIPELGLRALRLARLRGGMLSEDVGHTIARRGEARQGEQGREEKEGSVTTVTADTTHPLRHFRSQAIAVHSNAPPSNGSV